jgi:hypothetical protein
MLDADRPDLVHSVILFAAGGKVEPKPPVELALRTIFDPKSTEPEVLAAMKYMVGNPADAWSGLENPQALPCSPRRRDRV